MARSPEARNLTTGWGSERCISGLAEQLRAEALNERPWLAKYGDEVDAWCRSEALTRLLTARLDEVGPLNEDGEPRTGLLTHLKWAEGASAKRRASLGLTPGTEAKVAKDRAAATLLHGSTRQEAIERVISGNLAPDVGSESSADSIARDYVKQIQAERDGESPTDTKESDG